MKCAIIEPTNLDQMLAEAKLPIDPTPANRKPVESLAEILAKRIFNPTIEPPAVRAIYKLAESIVATPGNLCTITSGVKTGKTAVVGALAAAAMTGSPHADCLGFEASNPKGLALLHFDSEQSPEDHWHGVMRMLKRARIPDPPAWLLSYCLTGLGHQLAWECVQEAVRIAIEKHGGIHSILIDGVADLVGDVNDPGECNDFVAGLHGLAIERDCPIVGVIHFNPGGEKTRGHLGSQLERKAETNLRLDKADEVTCIWSEKQRRAPIPKASAPCFKWSDEEAMHISCESRGDQREAEKVERLREELLTVFEEPGSMRYAELKTTVTKRLSVEPRTAERKIASYRQAKLLTPGAAGHLIFKG